MVYNGAPLCTETFSILKPDSTALDGGLENLISINADGYIEVNEANYEGGDISVMLKVSNPYGDSVHKLIKITEKCASQTISKLDADKVYAF
jgi:hypothetical protein